MEINSNQDYIYGVQITITFLLGIRLLPRACGPRESTLHSHSGIRWLDKLPMPTGALVGAVVAGQSCDLSHNTSAQTAAPTRKAQGSSISNWDF